MKHSERRVSINTVTITLVAFLGLSIGSIALAQEKRWEEPKNQVQEFHEARGETEELYMKQAEQNVRRGKSAEAIEFYNKALEINDRSCKAYRGLIYSTEKKGLQELESLLRRLKKKEELDSNNSCLYYAMGLIFSVEGYYEKSTSYFKDALSLNPENPYALNGLGVFFLKQKEYDRAEKEFLAALRYDPAFPLPFRNLLGLYNETKQFDKALGIVEGFKGEDLSEYMRINLYKYYSFKKGDFKNFLTWYLKGLTYSFLHQSLMIAAIILVAILYFWSKKVSDVDPERLKQTGFGELVVFSVAVPLYWILGSSFFFIPPRSSYRLYAYLYYVVFSSWGTILLASIFIFYILKIRGQAFSSMWGTAKSSIVKSFVKNLFKIYLTLFVCGMIVSILSNFINTDVLSESHPALTAIPLMPDAILRSYMIFRVVLLGPFFEEIIFRGLLYTIIKALYGPKKGVYFSSFLFGLYHAQISIVLFAFVIGVFLAKSYEDTKSLTTPLLIHIFINSSATLSFMLFGIQSL